MLLSCFFVFFSFSEIYYNAMLFIICVTIQYHGIYQNTTVFHLQSRYHVITKVLLFSDIDLFSTYCSAYLSIYSCVYRMREKR